MFTWTAITSLFFKSWGLVTGGIGILFGPDKVSRILLIISLSAAGFLGFKLYVWDKEKKAEIAALQKFNKIQLDQVLEDKNRELQELKRLQELELSVIRENNKDLKVISEKYEKLKEEILKIQGDRAASEILKKTIEGLNKKK